MMPLCHPMQPVSPGTLITISRGSLEAGATSTESRVTLGSHSEAMRSSLLADVGIGMARTGSGVTAHLPYILWPGRKNGVLLSRKNVIHALVMRAGRRSMIRFHGQPSDSLATMTRRKTLPSGVFGGFSSAFTVMCDRS